MRKVAAIIAVLAVITLTACDGNSGSGEGSGSTGGSSTYREPTYSEGESIGSEFAVEFDDGEAEIVRYNGSGGEVRIPEEIDGVRVTEIESRAFERCAGLTSVVIPGSVKSIGEDAFADCVNLTSVTIEDGVREIDEYAFTGCTALNRLELPDSVSEIERFAFSGCDNLTVKYLGYEYYGDNIVNIYNHG